MLKRFPRIRLAGTLLLLLALLLSTNLTAFERSTSAQATPVASSAIGSEIAPLLATCTSVFGVVIIDAEDRSVFEQNADLPFVSASLYKLALLAETLSRVENGDLSLDQPVKIQPDFYLAANGVDSYFAFEAVGYEATVEELVYATGAYSSNVGAQALVSLTSPEQLEQFATGLGLTSTRYWLDPDEIAGTYGQLAERNPDPDVTRSIGFIESFGGYGVVNLTTPRDMATFFRLLRDDQLVSPLVSWRLKQVLGARVINDRIPALLPSGTTVIHKTGNLDGVLHDVGIIETPSGPVIAIVMAQVATDAEMTQSIEQKLGLLAYEIGADDGTHPAEVASPVAGPSDS